MCGEEGDEEGTKHDVPTKIVSQVVLWRGLETACFTDDWEISLQTQLLQTDNNVLLTICQSPIRQMILEDKAHSTLSRKEWSLGVDRPNKDTHV